MRSLLFCLLIALASAANLEVNFINNDSGGCGCGCGSTEPTPAPTDPPTCPTCPPPIVCAICTPMCPATSGGQTGNTGGKLAIFDEPTVTEMEDAIAALGLVIDLTCPQGVDCSVVGKYNYITVIDPIFPPKADALAYLECTVNCVPPPRQLLVTVNMGMDVSDTNGPEIRDYTISGFPGNRALANRGLTVDTVNVKKYPFTTRARDGKIINSVKAVVGPILSGTLDTLIRESFDGLFWGANGGLNLHATAPAGYLAADRIERCFLVVDVPDTSRVKDLIPLPLTWRVDTSCDTCDPSDISTWQVKDFYYARQGPFTADELAAAYASGLIDAVAVPPVALQKVTYPAGYRAAALEYVIPVRPVSTERGPFVFQPGPQWFYPGGKRYSISNRVVEWMGWKFHVTSLQKRGPVLHDITFMGERIAYEIQVQDVSLGYSANDPVQGNVFYFDGSFAIGETSDYIPHIDCPDYSDFMSNNWFTGTPTEVQTASCVYEKYTGDALWRRKEGVKSGAPETQLVVKFSLPVGNYDYIATFTFTLDGAIHVHYKASGNIQTYPYLPASAFVNIPVGSTSTLTPDQPRDAFGVRFYERSMGALHDHTFSIKVDLDVLGTANNFYTNEFPISPIENIPGWDSTRPPFIEPVYPGASYRWVRRTHQQTEVGFEADLANPMEYEFVGSQAQTSANGVGLNKWGIQRAYRITHHKTAINPFRGTGHPLQTGGKWRDYQIAVTERKETEPVSGSGYALWAPLDPDVQFENLLNQENIVDKDLVAWVSFGFLHLPRAEDSPVQPNAGSGFVIEPVNYFDENPAFNLPHLVENMSSGQMLESLPVQTQECVPRNVPLKDQ